MSRSRRFASLSSLAAFAVCLAMATPAAAGPGSPTSPDTVLGSAAQATTPAQVQRARLAPFLAAVGGNGPQLPTGSTLAPQPLTSTTGTAAPSPQSAQSEPADSTSGLYVITTPDPTVADSGAYIYTAASLAPPRVTVTAPDGSTSSTFAQAYPQRGWWTAPLPGGAPGVYRVSVTAPAADGSGPLTGAASFEVVPVPNPTQAASSWRAVGPNSIGGQFALDPQRPTTMYSANFASPAVWQTTDAGGTWREYQVGQVGAGLPAALVVDPADGSRLYLPVDGGTQYETVDPTYAGKLFTSADGGQHWSALPFPNEHVTALATNATGTTLAATTWQGLEVSNDGGRSWTQLDAPWPGQDVDQVTIIGTTLYVATFDGLFAVSDVTTSPQTPVNLHVPTSRIGNWVTGVAGDAHALYASSWADNVYVSHDGGASWSPVLASDGNLVWRLDDVAGTVYVSMGDQLLLSPDGGATWQHWEPPTSGSVPGQIAEAGGTTYVDEEDAGIYATRDGATWTRLGAPGADVNVLAMVGGSHDPSLLAGTGWGVYATALAGDESVDASTYDWHSPGTEGSSVAGTLQLAAGGGYAFTVKRNPFFHQFSVLRSSDAGDTWSSVYGSFGTAQTVYVDPADPASVYVTAGSGLLVSRDSGATWSRFGLPGTMNVLSGSPVDPNLLYGSGPGGLYESADGGQTWVQRSSSTFSAIDVLPTGRLVLGGLGLATSDDQGASVQPAAMPPLVVDVTALLSSPTNPQVLYAATGSFYEYGLPKGGRGVWRSSDGGHTWQLMDTGLSNLDTTSLAVSPDGRHLYVGATAGGVSRIKLPAVG